MTTRIAAVIAALFLTAGVIATLAPTSALGTSCGTWVAPEYDRDQVAVLLARGADTAADLEQLGADGSDLTVMGNRLAAATIGCDDKLDGRRLLTLIFLGLAAAVPGAIVWVGRGRDARPAIPAL